MLKAKLSPKQVGEIKERLAQGGPQNKQDLIAKDFGVSRSLISDINTGRRYPNVGGVAVAKGHVKKERPDPTDQRVQDLEAEIVHLREELQHAKRSVKEDRRMAGLFKALVNEMEQRIEPLAPLRPAYSVKAFAGMIEEDVVMHLSDGHHDQIVDPEECGGIEKYDFDISCRRAETYVSTVLDWTQGTLGGKFHFPRLWVLAYGDHTSGEIHGHTQRSYFRNQFNNTFAIGQLHALMYRELASHFGEVNVVYVPGNHGRTTPKKDHHGAHSNWDYAVAKVAQLHLKDVPNVSFLIPNSFSANLDINGIGFHVFHGDDVKSSLGLPWYGLARRQKGLQAINRVVGGPQLRYFCCGHFHKPGSIGDMDSELLVNGPWVATDAYAYNSFSGFTDPTQWLHGVHPRRGITWRLAVKLRSEGEETGPNRYHVTI